MTENSDAIYVPEISAPRRVELRPSRRREARPAGEEWSGGGRSATAAASAA